MALLAAAVVAVLAQTAGAQTWDCGETAGTVTATLSGGTLTISGAGKMKDYHNYGPDGSDIPWNGSKSSIITAIIEDGITHVGSDAFHGCEGLIVVTVPNSVTSIGNGAFISCKKLTSITIPNSVEYLGNYVFQYCSKLTSANIPDKLTSIGEGTFYGCNSLSSITIPNGVTSIGNYAFQHCEKLTSITIPNSVLSIEIRAFSYCAGLTSVVLGDNITSIGNGAFEHCTNLTSVAIPKSVTSIESYAFDQCSGLTSIINLNPVPPVISSDSFIRTTACLYIVDNAKEAYLSADYWKDFKCISTIQAAAIASNPRTVGIAVPPLNAKEATIAPLGNEFTIGPNPVDKSFGAIKFFRNGSHIASASLSVYNASGDVVKNIAIYDNDPISNNSKRSVGLWDLTDTQGRQVSAGTYLVKGILKTSNGTREKVSAVVGVR